jgi:hypothetical protein
MNIRASVFFDPTGVKRAALAVAIALAVPGSPASADPVNIPSCEQFVDFGRNWVGFDQNRVSHDLGLPLYQLTNSDIDHIAQATRDCLAAATTAKDKAILTDLLKQKGALTAARDRIRKAFSAFETAKTKSAPKLAQLTAKLDSLRGVPADRSAVDDAQAAISGIFFELDEKRNAAQVREPLTESFKPYMDALAAVARKRQALAESARLALVAQAEDAFGTRRAEFERLNVPEVAQDATIVLEGADAGSDVRWLTLRQWASLVLKNSGEGSLSLVQADDPHLVELKIVRPGYGDVIFAFRQDGRDLRLARTRIDGVLHEIVTPDDRQQAVSQLVAVAKSR